MYVVPDEVVESLTGYRVHRGALASLARKPLPEARAVIGRARRIIVLEDLVDHGNVGAIFRCAAALGVDAVVLSPRCADPLYRRSVKVSMGAVFAIPYARMTGWYDGLAELKSAGFRVLALTPDERATPIASALRDGRAGRAAARHRGGRAVRAMAARGRRGGAHPDEPGGARRRGGFTQRGGRGRHRLSPARRRKSMTAPSHAVVIGASIAGLLAAAALSGACPRVTLFERDTLPAEPGPRRGVPQTRQLHALQARGVQALDELLPGLRDELVAAGGVLADMQGDVHWYLDDYLLKRRAPGSRASGSAVRCWSG